MATDINSLVNTPVNKPLGKLGWNDAFKAFYMFLLATVTSVLGDALMQCLSTGDYSFASIHWPAIGGAIAVAALSYIQKQLLTNSKGQIMKKEDEVKKEDSASTNN